MAVSFVELFDDIRDLGKPNFETQRKRKELLIYQRILINLKQGPKLQF